MTQIHCHIKIRMLSHICFGLSTNLCRQSPWFISEEEEYKLITRALLSLWHCTIFLLIRLTLWHFAYSASFPPLEKHRSIEKRNETVLVFPLHLCGLKQYAVCNVQPHFYGFLNWYWTRHVINLYNAFQALLAIFILQCECCIFR